MSFFKGNGFGFELGKRTYIMGILNITPDSFYDGGKYNTAEKAAFHAQELERNGADIIDVGANSTRPHADILSVEAELEIIKELLPDIIDSADVPISVDTFYPEVARFALENGARIINDVSGKFNKEMIALINEYSAGYVVMHNPLFSSSETADYTDLGGAVKNVADFFEKAGNELLNAGVSKEQVLYDIGIGFSKSQTDDIELIRNLSTLKKEDRALLVALSNKRVTAVLSDMNKEERVFSTVAADTLAIANGADFIRVHNVRQAKIAAEITDRIVR